jgi:1-deoxy-D-xylulose-5-phosphate synthase
MKKETYLDWIESPHDLRRLRTSQLHQLADELRAEVIRVVSRRGGHLASNLGIAELTIALHYVFDFPRDRLLWDVGHQCYAHKLLTGRRERFDSLRQAGGLSGFPAPCEGPFDLFATGHAGTAISTAVGLAWADQAAGRDEKVVAVVGDASIVNGASFEGLNNAALLKRQFLIILNDNSMAIDRTRGALANALNRIRLTHTYADLKHTAEEMLRHLPLGGEITEAIRQLKKGLRTTLHGGRFFEPLGFTYFGPVDGNNIRDLIPILRRIAQIDHPVILHVHTIKGRGCRYAVEDPCRFHSPSAYTIENGKAVFARRSRPTWTSVFADALIALAKRDERIVAITAAMPDGTGLAKFREVFPDRCIDVGISESHAVAMAAGMAKAGLRPVVALYSTFMQRAFDQVSQEVALQGLPVLLCLDRAGLVGSDGAGHHGAMDIAYLRPLPGMVLAAPADAVEMRAAMEMALSLGRPVAIRYPRDEVPEDLPGPCPPFVPGKARAIADGRDATLLCCGVTVEMALAARRMLQRERGLDVGVVNARFAKPLDDDAIGELIAGGRPVLTCEDHTAAGGFGSAVLELAAGRGLSSANVRVLALPDRFIAHASRQEQLIEAGLAPGQIAKAAAELIGRSRRAHAPAGGEQDRQSG